MLLTSPFSEKELNANVNLATFDVVCFFDDFYTIGFDLYKVSNGIEDTTPVGNSDIMQVCSKLYYKDLKKPNQTIKEFKEYIMCKLIDSFRSIIEPAIEVSDETKKMVKEAKKKALKKFSLTIREYAAVTDPNVRYKEIEK